MFQAIESIRIQPDHKLLLHYSGGDKVLVDFKPLIERGGVFRALAEPQFFALVSIGDQGRYIEWPGNLDFCADALWQQGHHESPTVQNVGDLRATEPR